jgi:hypothetical protein
VPIYTSGDPNTVPFTVTFNDGIVINSTNLFLLENHLASGTAPGLIRPMGPPVFYAEHRRPTLKHILWWPLAGGCLNPSKYSVAIFISIATLYLEVPEEDQDPLMKLAI